MQKSRKTIYLDIQDLISTPHVKEYISISSSPFLQGQGEGAVCRSCRHIGMALEGHISREANEQELLAVVLDQLWDNSELMGRKNVFNKGDNF